MLNQRSVATHKNSMMTVIKLVTLLILSSCAAQATIENSQISAGELDLFADQTFRKQDAVLVVDDSGQVLYQWQANKSLIPASLTKLITAYLAVQKWGDAHRFKTEFYLLGEQLWVKGYGDPYLGSEEIDVIARELNSLLEVEIKSIHIDASMIEQEAVPGRTKVADPYNAPLSAVAANFNTITMKRIAGKVVSGESQTPLTPTSLDLAASWPNKLSSKPNRINLIDANRAQHYFAELLLKKINHYRAAKSPLLIQSIEINQTLPESAKILLRHFNSKPLAEVLRGALEYSNNFIANQVFLLLASESTTGSESKDARLSFSRAQSYVRERLKPLFEGQPPLILDGAGLTRANRISAMQLDIILEKLKPHQGLLKRYLLKASKRSERGTVEARAKTGTLNGVQSFAGFLNINQTPYRFVFIFNRATSYRYREQLLQQLADQLAKP